MGAFGGSIIAERVVDVRQDLKPRPKKGNRARQETHLLKAGVLHHHCHDPYKGLVTLFDYLRWLEVVAPIHNP